MNEPRNTRKTGEGRPGGSLTSDLKARIARARIDSATDDGPSGASPRGDMTGLGRGLRLGSEFVAAILVGAGMGYLLDQWLGTSPWLMLILLLLGFVAGVLNVVRTAAEMNRAATPPTDTDEE